MKSTTNTSIAIDTDMSGFDEALKTAKRSAEDFGRVFTSTIRSAIITGKGFEDTLRSIALRLSTLALNQAIAPFEKAISNALGSFVAGASGVSATPFAKGGAFGASGVIPFAQGGVVSSPSLFSFSGGTGLMGEAGPEAIIPLARGKDGRLGVASTHQSKPVNIVFNISTADASSFQRSEGQLTAMLARAVGRGQRNL